MYNCLFASKLLANITADSWTVRQGTLNSIIEDYTLIRTPRLKLYTREIKETKYLKPL